ncbi:hypothetical protein GCM10027435_04170 [Haloparvum alkalitolerans]|uniref:sensor histidine kinase n=1 Tax=Haloparvum alkalitolerans TaxID=1042953 RepID=UPI003CF71F4B
MTDDAAAARENEVASPTPAAEPSEVRATDVIVHELRNALAIATGNAALLAEDRTGPNAARETDDRALDCLRTALDRMGRTLDDAERIAAAERVESPARVDLERVAEAAFECVHHDAAAGETATAPTLTIECDTVAADPALLSAALENLFRNALEHGGDAVIVRSLPDGAGFLVADSGPGIDPDVREDVFDPGVSTRAGGGASGLGLHIVDRVASAHGWTVTVRDGPADYPGACFEFRTGKRATSE